MEGREWRTNGVLDGGDAAAAPWLQAEAKICRGQVQQISGRIPTVVFRDRYAVNHAEEAGTA
jgi:hypothetical protein